MAGVQPWVRLLLLPLPRWAVWIGAHLANVQLPGDGLKLSGKLFLKRCPSWGGCGCLRQNEVTLNLREISHLWTHLKNSISLLPVQEKKGRRCNTELKVSHLTAVKRSKVNTGRSTSQVHFHPHKPSRAGQHPCVWLPGPTTSLKIVWRPTVSWLKCEVNEVRWKMEEECLMGERCWWKEMKCSRCMLSCATFAIIFE